MRTSTLQGVLLGAVTSLVACQFERPRDVEVDARELDAPPLECTASTATCSNDRYTECDASGRYTRYEVPNGGGVGVPTTLVMHDFACPLGCAAATRCADPVAAHGVADTMPRWSDALADVDLTTSAGSVITIDTDATGAELELADAAGNTFRVPVTVVTQAGGPELLVLRMRSLTIRGDARIIAVGSRALAVAAAFDIVIAGRLDASGVPDAAGGITSGACVGTAGSTSSGGGGNWDAGGSSSAIDPGGMAQPMEQPLLVGGCSGGPIAGMAGYAGGAIQLSSRTRISLEEGAIVSVAGGGGRAFATVANFATGGGSGGFAYLEAPVVQIANTARVVGRGGSGAAAKAGQVTVIAQGIDGDADLSATTVPEVTCSGCGFGGAGGTSSTPPGRGVDSATGWGGGGGSVGRAVISTRTGAVAPPTGTLLLKHTLRTLARH
ncbi:MAG: hypothetical protein IPH44_19715 [Myxococcales bacterium]|nr:hypothetical protein [Myxococcales bacterium]